MQLKTHYRIRFSDCDSFRHLHNSRYIDYLIDAREDHLRDFHQMEMTDLFLKGLSWVVGNHDITYLKPALYGEQVCISSALIKAGDDDLLVEMLMTDEQEQQVKALLWTRFIHVSTQTGKRAPHPDWFMELIRPMQDPGFEGITAPRERLAGLMAR